MSDSSRWVRFASEGVLIVTSILLALWADAWMNERGDRAQEEIEIRGLHEQLLETRRDLVRTIQSDEAGVENTRSLIRIFEGVGVGGTALVSDTLLRRISSTSYFDPPLSRFESIIASGRLILIQDDQLRAAIADWPNRARAPQFPAASRREMLRNQFIPYLTTDHDLNDWFNSRPEGKLVAIRVDSILPNLLKARLWLDRVVLSYEQTLLEDLDELLRAMEKRDGEDAMRGSTSGRAPSG